MRNDTVTIARGRRRDLLTASLRSQSGVRLPGDGVYVYPAIVLDDDHQSGPVSQTMTCRYLATHDGYCT